MLVMTVLVMIVPAMVVPERASLIQPSVYAYGMREGKVTGMCGVEGLGKEIEAQRWTGAKARMPGRDFSAKAGAV